MEQLTVAVMPKIYIKHVFGSNPSRKVGYLDSGFSWFFSVYPGKCRHFLIRLRWHSSKFLPIHHSQVIHHSTPYSLRYWDGHEIYHKREWQIRGIRLTRWRWLADNCGRAWEAVYGTSSAWHSVPDYRVGPIESSRPYVATGTWNPTSVWQAAHNKFSTSVGRATWQSIAPASDISIGIRRTFWFI
jgi:hypothetical protein